MTDLHWRCLHCDAHGTTKPTKTTVGREAEKHVEATHHAITTSTRPVPTWMSGVHHQLVRGAA